ncbi:MAG TPA: alternative ribosome rescue aminoacyl-tRNA hydrolase ArfB [Cyclobacteriaceae bacterium]
MGQVIPQFSDLQNEIIFTTARSSGPGGQNVNKVNSKVTLRWDMLNSITLTDSQKQLVLTKLKPRLTNDGVLILSVQESRSQIINKEEVIKKFNLLLKKAFAIRKKRKSTKPTKSSVKKRVDAKKLRGQKKQWRQRPDH